MVTENPFAGATRDPIALLEQLLVQVAGLKRDLAHVPQDLKELKADVSQLKADVNQLNQRVSRLEAEVGSLRTEVAAIRAELAEVRGELAAMRREFLKAITAVDADLSELRTHVESTMERKAWLQVERLREQWDARLTGLERRLAELEAQERRRREGLGA